ncbi:hypothetical protein CspeluHIS016_0207760 [Cutaneotrichosporon spelunceum]|uniref:separase n=1 Tax=Cutaneotrichosporon spelunceum TaxID=1672016 RepID=A0AAD3TSP5_9TREE|nr:hypothetical protein CspeluHIS016_0207760 [Cutaneotrichosporon spelunceum]
MSAAKAAQPPRTTRSRKRADVESLADDLDRVLKVSQPKSAPRRIVSATKLEPKKPSSRSAVKPAPKTAVKPKTEPTSTSSKAPAGRSAPPVRRTATKAAAPPPPEPPAADEEREELPWLKSGAMSTRDRGVAAQGAVNDALRLLGEAMQAGFKHTAPKGQWTRARVDDTFQSGRDGLTVLRELYGRNSSPMARRATIEKAGIAIVTRYIGFEMYEAALGSLAETRPSILELYEHEEEVPRQAHPPVTQEWAKLFELPAPTGNVDEAVLSILGSFALASWCCLLSLGLQAEIRQIAAFGSALSASGSGDAKNSPDRVWSSVWRTVELHLENGGDGAKRQVAEYIGTTVDIVEVIWTARNEPRDAWFSGRWSAVLDIWTDIGRTLGDSSIVDRVLSAATAGTSLTSSASSSRSIPSPTPSTSAPPSTASTPRKCKMIPRVANAAAEVTRLCAQIAKVLVDTAGPSVGPETYKASLASVDFEAIHGVLCSLKPSERTLELITPLLRAVERLRRLAKSLDTAGLTDTSSGWLQNYIQFAVRLLPELQPHEAVRECLPGLCDTAVTLMRRSTTPESTAISLEQLDAVAAALASFGSELGITAQTNYASCLIHCAYSVSLAFSKADAIDAAVAFSQRSCEWAQSFLEQNGDSEEVVRKMIAGPLSKRFELLGFCLQKGSDQTAALHAFIKAFLCLDSSAVKHIGTGAASKPLRIVFDTLPEFTTVLKRAASLLARNPALGPEFLTLVANDLNEKQWSPAVTGAILEQVVDALEQSQFLPHVQGVLVALLDMLLGLYETDAYPVRRLRVVARFVSVIISTGTLTEQYESLKLEAGVLVKAKELAKDSSLAKFRQEYYTGILINGALQTYYQPESSSGLAKLGRVALDATQAFISPAPPAVTKRTQTTRSKAPMAPRTKTPAKTTNARKVTPTTTKKAVASAKTDKPQPIEFDDSERFCDMLNALASLFGLLGYLVPKIETLNLLRAIQRTDMPDDFLVTSSQVAAVYGRLGKYSRATQLFAKSLKHTDDAAPAACLDLHLRNSRFLATRGQLHQARAEFEAAARLAIQIPEPVPTGTYAARWIQVCAATERMALAYAAAAAIKMAEEDVTASLAHLTVAYRLWGRAAAGVAQIAASSAQEPDAAEEASAEGTSKSKGKKPFCFVGKRLGGLQWYFAESLFEATFDIALALAEQGSVKECEYYLLQARGMVASVRSSTLDARTASRTAEFETRRLRFDKTIEQIDHAISVLTVDGPEVVEIERVKGEMLSRQAEGLAADERFAEAVTHLVGLDKEFTSAETNMPSARKDSIVPAACSREPLLPQSLGHLLRQRVWLTREGGDTQEFENVVEQLESVPCTLGDKPQQLLLEARLAMYDVFRYFKTDLFMSSLNESTIALTMDASSKRGKSRHTSQHEAVLQLEHASAAFRNALTMIESRGRVEDVRQTCVSLAVLSAFKTSLGHGSPATTASTASTLASAPMLTLHRELLAAIDSKYADPEADDMDWPVLDAAATQPADALQAYWAGVRARHADLDLLGDCDLSTLPTNWAIVSITVTDDRNTMLVTRHQNGHEPIVFCIPLDRQGRREDSEEHELFTFHAGVAELRAILAGNDESIRSIKDRVTMDDRKAWWRERHELDTRLSELLATIEFCWLGAFKTVLNPRLEFDPDALETFRTRLDRIFHAAIAGAGSDTRKASSVRLNDTLLACFATLPAKCRDEEVEDLVYFVLDLYQFHGIAVVLAELDFEQIGHDVQEALAALKLATGTHPPSDEHLLLALDKNVQCFPWESIPILRGRAVSRIASLPLLLDHVALGTTLGADPTHRTVNARKARYFLNPGCDLVNTQQRFEPRLKGLQSEGWEGITARRPSEAEMSSALSDSELVMYFGHGGGEEYLRGHKVRALKRCAVTMLWGCSSGLLREQGDLDPTGTPHDYLLAGSPCLVGNLWDVTDKDIDRITTAVMDSLGLEEKGIRESSMSVVQAVSQSRSAARLQYLTGAALVVYGVPVYMA